ncbi:MAG TPA: MFS transporter [Candidatus Sulfotelmatobacter sp.]|jgi:MFS family permease|nr:MFS transporter [Candidatus Sulfotelmatobacter sp.]
MVKLLYICTNEKACHAIMGNGGTLLSGRFWWLIAATFLGFLGFGSVLPGLAPHVRHDLGGSDRTVGFVIGIFSVVALCSRIVAGPLADRKGRKRAFLTGLGSCTLAGIAYLLPWGIGGIYFARILQGVGEACLYTGAAAWAVEVAGVHRSARALGYLSSGIWGGIAAGPLVGQLLGSFNNAARFQVVAALSAAALLTQVPEDYQPSNHSRRRGWLRRSIVPAGIAVGFVNVHYPVITGFLILYLARHGNSGPAAFSTYAGFVLLSRFFLGGLPDRIHPRITFYTGLTCMALGLAILATGPGWAGAVCGAGLLGFGFSFPWASVASTVLRATPDGERGSAVSVLSAFYDLFVGISAFSAGLIANTFGYAATFLMAIAAVGAAAVAGRFVFVAPKPDLSHSAVSTPAGIPETPIC